MGSMPDPPDRDRAAADEQRIAALLRAVEVPAPVELRRAIAERNAAVPQRQWWRQGPAIGLGLAGAAAGACVALILVLTSGSAAAPPTVVRASLVALERPAQPARGGLVAAGTTIAFPDWSHAGWPASGIRRSSIGGRAVTTEYFRAYDSSSRFGYAIVAGSPIGWGAAGRAHVVHGEAYAEIDWGGSRIVTWVQDGHTCILASRSTPSRTLLALAAAQESGSPT
jgi:hypothetical protein